MAGTDTNGWDRYQKLVLAKLEDHDKLLGNISSELTNIKVELGQLRVKAGVWGAIGAAIPTIAAVLFILLSK